MNLKIVMIGILMGVLPAVFAQSSANSADATAIEKHAASSTNSDCQYPINDIRFFLCKL
ncbi:hypothetical protein GGR77_001572 [Xanthomonas translucens]